MCGLNGIFSIDIKNDIAYRVNKMNESLIHRGPDDGNLYIKENKVALGHRRLSIIDTNKRSNQPMISNSKRWTIVFNGEIYNYKKLKENLNYRFKTESDTEVILAFVEEFGVEEFLNKSNGMFAIALYDNLENAVYIARDRMGIKPLYYCLCEDAFVFSSEIKAILNSGLVDAQFNEDVIDEYLGNRYIREPNTFFKNIYQLKAGSYMVIDKSLNMKNKVYWNLPLEFNMEENYDEESITSEFESHLTSAIERRLIADVPLGTYLSGGVDSSLITAITSKKLDTKLNTFTIGFPELNEFPFANMVAEKYDTCHHVIEIGINNYFDKMNEVISYKDAPLGVPNEIPLAIMSKYLKEKITVVLSGEGADELLGGYGRIFRSPFDFKNNCKGPENFYEYFIGLYEYVPRIIRDKYLNTKTEIREYFDDEIKNKFKMNSNEENVFRFFHTYHVKGLLQRVDATTMLAGVEARVPFLDHELIEFAYKKIPYNLKLKWRSQKLMQNSIGISSNDYSEINDIPKYILKKLSYKYLPTEVIERKKIGFPVPLNEWFNSLEQVAKETLKEAYWLKINKLGELIEESKKNARAGQIIWMFINIELFRQMYFNKKWTY
jgi:asparagine synthase (glutamine-hydrolysing)